MRFLFAKHRVLRLKLNLWATHRVFTGGVTTTSVATHSIAVSHLIYTWARAQRSNWMVIEGVNSIWYSNETANLIITPTMYLKLTQFVVRESNNIIVEIRDSRNKPISDRWHFLHRLKDICPIESPVNQRNWIDWDFYQRSKSLLTIYVLSQLVVSSRVLRVWMALWHVKG